MAHGFVYFLENASMRGLVKIGFTKNHPMERAKQLSASTSCPVPFTVLAYFGHADAQWAEAEIHQYLCERRINGQREFFNAPYYKLQDAMRQYGDPHADAFYCARLDLLAKEEEQWLNAQAGAL